MADIPGFFNKLDFFGILLPGYIAVILFLVLIRPDILVKMTGKEPQISFDLFSAVLFLVAGPAVGYIVGTFHRYVYSIAAHLSNRDKKQRQADVIQYAEIRIEATVEEKLELDSAESSYDFNDSTAIVLLSIGIYYSIYGSIKIIVLPIFFMCILLFIGAYFELTETYNPTYETIRRKHNIR
jgi:hypothetical protein